MNPLFDGYYPGSYAGVRLTVKDAQEQMRTPRDVRGPWVRPRCPSKLKGRKGTRRWWKRRNAPGWTWYYREPTDVIMYEAFGSRYVLVTPQQADVLSKNLR